MELDKLWNWESRKLACRIRSETSNPSGDELRERFSELAGVDYREIIADMKNSKKKKDLTKLSYDGDGDKTFKDLLNRSHILGAAQQSLQKLKDYQESQKATIAKKNIHKQYALLPKSPPRRVMLDIQRIRALPDIQLPDQDEDTEGAVDGKKKGRKQSKHKSISIYRTSLEEEVLKKELEESEHPKESLMGSVLPGYEGDMFGTGGPYLESMIYLSRMADAETKTHRKRSISEQGLNERDTVIINQSSNNETSRINEDNRSLNNEFDANLDDENNLSAYEAKVYCAMSLCNWSRDPSNATRLAQEGAVRAILQLLLEPHFKILKYCAAAYRFMSEQLPLAIVMIDEGITNTVADVILSATDEFITHNMAIALVNLTRVSGREAQLVDAAAVLALQNLIVVQPDLSGACARGLYNLTCVDAQYNYIERVIRALVALSTSTLANVKHICAAALCNLSDLRSVRPRLVEEGVISIVGQLARGAETRTRRICAVILQNLSASKLCRVDMTSKSSVSVAFSLSADQDPIILRAVSLTLSRLASEPVNSNRIVHESGITALCNIGVKYPTIPAISQPISVAFQLLSSRPSARLTIVQEGSITAIASLLRISTDLVTIQNALLSLCYLLLEPESHLPIVQQGLVITIMNLMTTHNKSDDNGSSNETIKDLCALAFFNLSSQKNSRKHIVNAGAVSVITSLSSGNSSDITKRRCAATLCNVSYYVQGFNRMVNDGVIQCLVNLLLFSDIETIHYSCAAICRLCINEENGRLIYESGAIPNLVKGANEGDSITKQFCGAVLSALSFYEICRIPLCESGILKVLSTLSSLKDDVSKQRCLIAYANLSCEKSVQLQMIDEGVVKIISSLADSYQEANYLCCAKAMCNLSCNPELARYLATDGGIYALLMICMVHSVDNFTKLLCVQTFLNIFNEETVDVMLEEGIIGAIGNLSKINDNKITYVCALLFNQLSKYGTARAKLTEKPSYLLSLFHVYHSFDIVTELQSPAPTNPSNTIERSVSIAESNASPSNQSSEGLVRSGSYGLTSFSVDFVDYQLKTKILIARTGCNMILCKEGSICDKTMESGVVAVIERALIEIVAADGSYDTLTHCLLALHSACLDMKYSHILESQHLLTTLVQVASQLTEQVPNSLENYMTTLKIIALIGWDSLFASPRAKMGSRGHTNALHTDGFTYHFIELILTNYRPESISLTLTILRYIVSGHHDTSILISQNIVSALEVIYTRAMVNDLYTGDCEGDHLEYIVEIVRMLSEKGGSSIAAMCSPTIVNIVEGVVDKISSDEIRYDAAVIVYLFSTAGSENRQQVSVPKIIDIIVAASAYVKTYDLLAAALFTFLFDTKCRIQYTVQPVAELFARIILSKPNEPVLTNSISACFAISKLPKYRELLTLQSVSLDTILTSLSHKTDSSKIRHNCARVIKNLSADSCEAIEEGAVATLIALSLEGRPKSKIGNDVCVPEIELIRSIKNDSPWFVDEAVYDGEWYDEYTPREGGPAGKGPDPPSPPVMLNQGTNQYPVLDDADSNLEPETKSKMAFAKMQVPLELKSSFLMNDDELNLKMADTEDDDEENAHGEHIHHSDTKVSLNEEVDEGKTTGSKSPDTKHSKGSKQRKAGRLADRSDLTSVTSTVSSSDGSSRANMRKTSKGKMDDNASKDRDDDFSLSNIRKAKNHAAGKAAQLGLYA